MTKLFTFVRVYENGQTDIATVLANDYSKALETCRKQFEPRAYNEIELSTIESVVKNSSGMPVILANNEDLKEV